MNEYILVLSPLEHREKKQIRIDFAHNSDIIRLLKPLGTYWTNTHKCWYIIDTPAKRKALKNLADVTLDVSAFTINISNKQTTAGVGNLIPYGKDLLNNVDRLQLWMRSKRYSENTIKTYTDALKTFLHFYRNKPIATITNEDVIIFNNEYILKQQLSASYQNQVVNAIKLFFRTIYNRAIDIELIHRPKRAKLLPNVLSKEEIKTLLNAHGNIKHKAMLSLIYSCGLRCSELLNLKPTDVDSKRNVLIIKQSKGRKDRIAPLSSKIVEMLREYFVAFKPDTYLFEGQTKGNPYDARSLQKVLKQAMAKAKIYKPVTLHWLRHSYATHLLENGTDLRYIQEILGHSSSKTTEIYTHVSTKSIQNIVSPFDTL